MSAIDIKQIQKPAIILFSLRLAFYLSVLVLLAIHPAIAISFDRIGIVQWFVIVPVLTVFAFITGYRVQGTGFRTLKFFIIAGSSLLILSLIAGGFSTAALWPFFAGVISFVLTFLLFNYPRWGKLSLLEPFFLIWVCLRMLALSRAGEEIAGSAALLTQFILVWSCVVFLLYGVVVYFCLFPQSKKGAGKEASLFFIGAAAALVLVLAVLPVDFIRNSIVENLNQDRMPELINESSEKGIPREGRRQGRRTTPRDGSGQQQRPGLRGLSEDNWHSLYGNRGRQRGKDGESEENLQYTVKIVISETEPVYMADFFYGKLDPAEGFLKTENDPLNGLSEQRLFSTWRNSERHFDFGRERKEVISLSTLQQRYLPYYPVTADPAILNEDSGPLRYIHQVVSDIHAGNPMELIEIPARSLSSREENYLASYLEVPLNDEDVELFAGWLEKAMLKWENSRHLLFNDDEEVFEPVNDYLETIFAILTAFSEYQYNLSYEDEAPVERLKEFLFDTKDGDCVEFSNSAALLGRFAGIPSRVVTGYLAAESMQTDAHLRGLANLRRQIPFLQQFPFDNLFLVTNMHAHSWTQFYIPDYGWLDFEATQFAIPPLPSMDANNFDVVIPIIEKGTVITNLRKFPWRTVFRTAGIMLIAALVGAYAVRYGREAVLYARSRKGGRDGARALYLLLLAKLAADGKPIKPASKTASEYTELFYFTQRTFCDRNDRKEHSGTAEFKEQQDHFKKFSSLYSEMRWREFEDKNDLNEKYELLKQEYQKILIISKRKGIGWFLIRIISLRGLAYL